MTLEHTAHRLPPAAVGRAPSSTGASPEQAASFRRLWTGQTISLVGANMGDTAVKLLAAAVLAATPFQLGLLTASQTAGFLLFGLVAGVAVDHLPRRPVLVVCDALRGALLVSIPLLWWLGGLSLPYLLVISLLVSLTSVLFEVAYQSVLPSLVPRLSLASANGKLECARSAAAAGGPAMGGAAVQALGAAYAVGFNAVAHLVASIFFFRMRVAEQPRHLGNGRTIRADIAEGLRFVLTHRALRAITAAAATFNLCYGILSPLVVALLITELSLPATTVGWLFASAGGGGFFGAVLAQSVIPRLGMARAICLAEAVTGPACLLLIAGSGNMAVPAFALGYLCLHLALSIFNVAQVSFRQSLCPPQLLGRMNASVRFLMWGALPVGSLAGGLLATVLSVRVGIAVAAGGLMLAAAGLFRSPLWQLRSATVEDSGTGVPSGTLDQATRRW